MARKLTHQDETGRPRMVDVSAKEPSLRTASAEGFLRTRPATLDALRTNQTPKGDPLVVARIAGIQAAKRTADLLPLCHPLPLSSIEVDVGLAPDGSGLRATATVRVHARTGVEMEALTAVTASLLAAYDMLKAIDRDMRIEGIRLLRKTGGRSGDWEAAAPGCGEVETPEEGRATGGDRQET